MRSLSPEEQVLMSFFSELGIPCSYLCITKTGITKGYTDATVPFREFLSKNNIHDFKAQGYGEDHNRYMKVDGWTPQGTTEMEVCLHRPATKKGRFYRLSKIGSIKRPLNIEESDVIFMIYRNQRLLLFNLTKIATKINPTETELEINENQGATITQAALDRIIHVMNFMPDCNAKTGNGAPIRLIADISGLESIGVNSVPGLTKSLIDTLVKTGKIEICRKGRSMYRLCL